MSLPHLPSDLTALASFPFPVYTSMGFEQQAVNVAERCARAFDFMSDLFFRKPRFYVQILADRDWASHTDFPVYGMPHMDFTLQHLTVAIEPSEFWQGFTDIIRESSPANYRQLQHIYRADGNQTDLSFFFNLLVIHELAHFFHYEGPCEFPRLWLKEFFCNLSLHAYIASTEPDQLPILETFPRLMTEVDPAIFEHRSLDDFERFYSSINPVNYGWYQTQLHVAAKSVYDTAGIDALKALWQTFLIPENLLMDRLRYQVHPSVADILTTWPNG